MGLIINFNLINLPTYQIALVASNTASSKSNYLSIHNAANGGGYLLTRPVLH